MRGDKNKNKIIGTGDFNHMLKSLPMFSVFHVSKFAPDMTDVSLKKFSNGKIRYFRGTVNCFSISKERRGFD